MKTQIQRLFCALICVAALVIVGCGGGTTGTDGGGLETLIYGLVRNPDQSPAPGLTVTVLETGDSALTDVDGRFTLSVPQNTAASLTLQVEGEGVSSSVDLSNRPQGDQLSLVLEVGSSGNVVVADVRVAAAPPPERDPKETEPPNSPSVDEPELLTLVRGTLRGESGEALEGVRIAIQSSSASDRTDRAGRFRLQVQPGPSRLILEIQYNSQTASVYLRHLPTYAVLIDLDLVLTGRNGQEFSSPYLDKVNNGTKGSQRVAIRNLRVSKR